MQVEIRNVKYAAFASEETSCFEATIYVDGKKAGTASNEGRGGCTMIHPHTLQQQLDAYGATLPLKTFDGIEQDGQPVTYQPDAESIIDDLLTAHLIASDLRRALRTKLMFVRAGKVYETKPRQQTPAFWCAPERLARTLESLKAETILNALPFDAALAIYQKAA